MYTLDTNAAKQADNIGAYISETGKYIGDFIRAEKLVAPKGTHGVGFTFKSDGGQESRFDIYTMKKDGNKLPGYNQLMAIMTCLQVKTLTESIQRVKKWDAAQNKEAVMDATVFPELMNKKVGLLLRSEEYEKMKDGFKTGETGWRIGLFASFQVSTELMASEILERKTKPEQLAKLVAVLSDRPLKKSSKPQSPQGPQNIPHSADMADDDIPW